MLGQDSEKTSYIVGLANIKISNHYNAGCLNADCE